MLVCRDAVIMLFRYVLEGTAEQEVLELAAGTSILNASITRYVRPLRSGAWIGQVVLGYPLDQLDASRHAVPKSCLA